MTAREFYCWGVLIIGMSLALFMVAMLNPVKGTPMPDTRPRRDPPLDPYPRTADGAILYPGMVVYFHRVPYTPNRGPNSPDVARGTVYSITKSSGSDMDSGGVWVGILRDGFEYETCCECGEPELEDVVRPMLVFSTEGAAHLALTEHQP